MNRNIILGRDWLVQIGYVPIEEDMHITSIVRFKIATIRKPQTANV